MKLLSAVIILIAIYIFQKVLYRKNWDRELSAELSFSKNHMECGEKAELLEVISNNKLLPLPVFHFKFSLDRSLVFENMENASVTDRFHKNEIFSVMGREKVTRRMSFRAEKRGIFQVESASILVRDFFLTSTFAKMVECRSSLMVFPSKLSAAVLEPFMRGIMGELEARRSVVEDMSFFRGIREYRSTDSMRAVNWKASARRGELMVNMFGWSMDARVMLLLNLDTDVMVETERMQETAISLCSTIARELLERKVAVSLLTNGLDADKQPVPAVSYGAELSHGLTIDESLTRICGSGKKDMFLDEVDALWKTPRPEIVYLIVSPYQKQDLLERIDRAGERGDSVMMIVPYYDEFGYKKVRDNVRGWEVPLHG